MGGTKNKVAGPFLEDRLASPSYYDDFRRQTLQHFNALYKFATYLSSGSALADDLVQETYLRAFRFEHRFEPGTHLRAWLFQIMRNVYLTFYNRNLREVPTENLSNIEGNTSVFSDAPVYNGGELEERADLGRALMRLPEEFTTPLLLAEVAGLPIEDIARIMNTPSGTVKSRIFRAKERLRGYLTDYSDEYEARASSFGSHNGNGTNTVKKSA